MELTPIRYFLAVAEELHFGRAARRVRIAQPPLSQSVRKLEDELGVKLFERTSRRVRLTEAGKLFLEEARRAVALVDAAVLKTRRLGEGETGRLAVGFNEPAMNVFLPATIQAFRKRYPEARLVLRELETADQLKALRDGAIDLGLPRLFGQDTEGLRIGPLFRERYALALPAAHPLTALKEIPLERVKGEPMVMMPRELQPALRDCLVERCVSVGFAPNIVQEAVSKQTTLALVEVGVGLAFVPMSSERQRPAGVVLRPLVGPLPDIEISAVSRAEATAAIIDNFIVLAKATIARRFRERNVAPINP